jgi:hypothetical protein
MSDNKEKDTLESQLEEGDWALIIGSNGNLKGMFIPDGSDEDEVPDSIIRIMYEYFGINFDDEEVQETSDGQTIH